MKFFKNAFYGCRGGKEGKPDNEEMASLGAMPTPDVLGAEAEKMKIDQGLLKAILRDVVIDENQILLLKIEEIIMSSITPIIQDLTTKVQALKAENDTLKGASAQKDQQLADVQAQLAAAQQNAVDPADVQALTDLSASLPPVA